MGWGSGAGGGTWVTVTTDGGCCSASASVGIGEEEVDVDDVVPGIGTGVVEAGGGAIEVWDIRSLWTSAQNSSPTFSSVIHIDRAS